MHSEHRVCNSESPSPHHRNFGAKLLLMQPGAPRTTNLSGCHVSLPLLLLNRLSPGISRSTAPAGYSAGHSLASISSASRVTAAIAALKSFPAMLSAGRPPDAPFSFLMSAVTLTVSNSFCAQACFTILPIGTTTAPGKQSSVSARMLMSGRRGRVETASPSRVLKAAFTRSSPPTPLTRKKTKNVFASRYSPVRPPPTSPQAFSSFLFKSDDPDLVRGERCHRRQQTQL
ncbi:hypothetical protein LMG24076_02107 [Trinickia soli]|nr:hypothetical protein LMG24076_02107 [Trinickia soli]